MKIALAAVVAAGLLQATATERAFTLADLTVPADRLPEGCGLKVIEPSRSEAVGLTRSGGRTMRFFAATPSLQPPAITANPWIGTEPQSVGWVRRSVDGYSVRLPDGPPLTKQQESALIFKLADGVELAYSATYTATSTYEPSRDLAVYAVQFAPGVTSARRFSYTSDALVVERGRIRAVFSRDRSPCARAIETYLSSLPK